MISMTAQLQLPKGTEHFLSDIHGEYEAFQHVLKNGSGSIRRKIEELFANTLPKQERRNLATLIYYPTRNCRFCYNPLMILPNGTGLPYSDCLPSAEK